MIGEPSRQAEIFWILRGAVPSELWHHCGNV